MLSVTPELSGYYFRRLEVLKQIRHTLDIWHRAVCLSKESINRGLSDQIRINKIIE